MHGEYDFKANGQVLKFKGFMTLYVEGKEEKDEQIPELTEGEEVKKEKIAKGHNIRKRDRAKLVIALGLVFAAIFAISYRNSQIDESFTKNEEMKKQYISMEKENDQMKVDIENNLNLNNVEQQAKELLGMQRLTNKQTVYISLPKKDYIQPAAESVIIEEDEGIVEKILNKIKNIF